MELKITSNGSISGTKVELDKKLITEDEYVTNLSFYVNGGVTFSDGDIITPKLRLRYDTLEYRKDGSIIRKNYEYDPEGGYRINESPIGKEDIEKVTTSDEYVGKTWKIIEQIDELRTKTKNFIPSNDKLEIRTHDSLQDLLNDLRCECGS